MIDNIIYDIFEDKEIAINRATLEIQKYQEQLSNKLNSNKLYTEYLPVNNDSLGLQIDILENVQMQTDDITPVRKPTAVKQINSTQWF